MMRGGSDFLKDRKRSLEEEFFSKENQKLLDNLSAMRQMEKSIAALSEASGIGDEALLVKLFELGVRAETVAALAVVPLVEVAWADGGIDGKERQAILDATHASGVERGGLEYELLESWLSQPPKGRLLEVWEHYIQTLCAELSQEEAALMKDDLIGRVRAVAEASGGFLGLGSVSQAESKMLARLEAAFEKASV